MIGWSVAPDAMNVIVFWLSLDDGPHLIEIEASEHGFFYSVEQFAVWLTYFMIGKIAFVHH